VKPAERTLRARRAAHVMHSRGQTNTGPARAAFLKRFEDEVDPERSLPEAERQKRAGHALKAHMAQLRLQRRQP